MLPTALIVEVPDAENIVSDIRRKYDSVSLRGVPAHITALYPFALWDELDTEVVRRVQACAQQITAFEFNLVRIEEFPDAIWLKPEPDSPFRSLTKLLTLEFPEFAPYGGRFDDPHPHLTLAQVGDAEHQRTLVPELTTELKNRLPHPCSAVSFRFLLATRRACGHGVTDSSLRDQTTASFSSAAGSTSSQTPAQREFVHYFACHLVG